MCETATNEVRVFWLQVQGQFLDMFCNSCACFDRTLLSKVLSNRLLDVIISHTGMWQIGKYWFEAPIFSEWPRIRICNTCYDKYFKNIIQHISYLAWLIEKIIFYGLFLNCIKYSGSFILVIVKQLANIECL